MIQVLHCVGSLALQSGGPAQTVTALTDSLAAEGSCSVILLSQNLRNGAVVAADPESRVDRRLACSRSTWVLKAGWPLKRLLDTVIPKTAPALLHDNGLWMPSNHYVAIAARRFRIPLVIHTHGMLEPWALQHRGWKKRLALWLYQRRNLETAALLFATAEQEAESIRRLGLRQPIAVIPNGVRLPVLQPNRALDERVQPGPRTALFLSRIHPKKGLLNLVEAWGRVRPANWRLCLAGPDEGGHLAVVMRRIRELGLETAVEYVGEVEGDMKTALFANAELFVLPTFSENFGVVVAEALAYGVPVITTHGTPWQGLATRGCGWWIEPTVEALVETLREVLALDAVTLQQMGMKGHAYAREFDWTSIAQQTVEVYRWVLGQGDKPDCVMTD